MSKLKKVLLAVCLFVFFFAITPVKKASAAEACSNIYGTYQMITPFPGGSWPNIVQGAVDYIALQPTGNIRLEFKGLTPSISYTFRCWIDIDALESKLRGNSLDEKSFITDTDGNSSLILTDNKCFSSARVDELAGEKPLRSAHIELENVNAKCESNNYTIQRNATGATCQSLILTNQRQSPNFTCYQPNDQVTWEYQLKDGANLSVNVIFGPDAQTADQLISSTADATGHGKGTVTINGSSLGQGLIARVRDLRNGTDICTTVMGSKKAVCGDEPLPPQQPLTQPYSLCKQIPTTSDATTDLARKGQDCCECATGSRSRNADGTCSSPSTDPDFVPGIWTAVGCIKADQEGIVTKLIRVGIGLSGGVALIMILVAAFTLTTSQGEPKRAGEAREMLTSAIIGLLFIIFSVTILQFIGVSVLKIPDFGSIR